MQWFGHVVANHLKSWQIFNSEVSLFDLLIAIESSLVCKRSCRSVLNMQFSWFPSEAGPTETPHRTPLTFSLKLLANPLHVEICPICCCMLVLWCCCNQHFKEKGTACLWEHSHIANRVNTRLASSWQSRTLSASTRNFDVRPKCTPWADLVKALFCSVQAAPNLVPVEVRSKQC